jgi:hypothetical protein
MDADRQAYSRHQILCAERDAWLEGETKDGDTFYYDGVSFWRVAGDGKKSLVPSWRAPGYGWRHDADCTCYLCSALRPARLHPASVA